MNNLVVHDPRQYDYNTAQWIAQEHAKGDTLLALHEAHEDTVPAPLIITRWRREFPAFDFLMIEAEAVRADVLVDQTLVIADSDARTAGAARNSIQSRQWLAARLSRDKYSQHKTIDSNLHIPSDGKDAPRLSEYSDADLQAIMRAGLKATSIEGESVVVPAATPGTPPGQVATAPVTVAGKDTPTPNKSLGKPPVTTNVSNTEPPKIFTDEESFYEQEPEF